jgi:L-asparaginase
VPAPLERVMEMVPFYDPVERVLQIGRTAVQLDFASWPEPIDSANITSADWRELAEIIREKQNEYGGFVILHGTDTLAYTASALAFILDSLDRPVVVTGSQRPIGQPRSDALQNLITSIEVAAAGTLGATVVPEVCVFFRDRLFRGCRTTKVSATSFNAFESPNMPPLGLAGDRLAVDEKAIARPAALTAGSRPAFDERIACVTLFPGMSTAVLDGMLNSEDLRGIVLQAFGNGNCPSTPQFLDAIASAVEAGRLIVDITQCRSGEVDLGPYPGSLGLLSRGVIPGMDMTVEAALAKLSFLLGNESDSMVVADRMQINMRGEQRQSIFNLHFGAGEIGAGESATLRPVRPMVAGARYRSTALDRAVLRVLGLSSPEAESDIVPELSLWLDPAEPAGAAASDELRFLGRVAISRRGVDGKSNAILEVTEQVRALVRNRHLNSLTITAGDSKVAWERLDLAMYADC